MPEFAGMERFRGRIVHPQHWPEDLDYAGKRVVVIGSGATAVTLVPAMAEEAGHVTMLQRSPTYVMAIPGRPDREGAAAGAAAESSPTGDPLEGRPAQMGVWFCKRCPEAAKRIFRRGSERSLPAESTSTPT